MLLFCHLSLCCYFVIGRWSRLSAVLTPKSRFLTFLWPFESFRRRFYIESILNLYKFFFPLFSFSFLRPISFFLFFSFPFPSFVFFSLAFLEFSASIHFLKIVQPPLSSVPFTKLQNPVMCSTPRAHFHFTNSRSSIQSASPSPPSPLPSIPFCPALTSILAFLPISLDIWPPILSRHRPMHRYARHQRTIQALCLLHLHILSHRPSLLYPIPMSPNPVTLTLSSTPTTPSPSLTIAMHRSLPAAVPSQWRYFYSWAVPELSHTKINLGIRWPETQIPTMRTATTTTCARTMTLLVSNVADGSGLFVSILSTQTHSWWIFVFYKAHL